MSVVKVGSGKWRVGSGEWEAVENTAAVQPTAPSRVDWYHDGSWERGEAEVIVESSVGLTVNGEFWMTFNCTPLDLEALAVGFLFNEGVIQKKEEIELIQVCERQDNVDVWLNHRVQKPTFWRRTSGCTGGVTALDSPLTPPESAEVLRQSFDKLRMPHVSESEVLRQAQHASGTEMLQHAPHASPEDALSTSHFPLPTPHFPLPIPHITPEEVNHLLRLLFETQQLYRSAGGVHTSILSDGVQVLAAAEDIGRHNTLDKIAGLWLLNGRGSSNDYSLVTTGRISSEMMQKAIRIGASRVISCTSPSSLSIRLAEQYGILLIGYARGGRSGTNHRGGTDYRFSVYTCQERTVQNTAAEVLRQAQHASTVENTAAERKDVK